MSQKQPRLPHNQRCSLIKEHYVEETHTQLAERCGVERRTIDRDIAYMKKTGDWWNWLEHAMLHYGRKKTVSDTVKFQKYADLYAKHFITSKETTEHKGEIVIKGWNLGDAEPKRDSD